MSYLKNFSMANLNYGAQSINLIAWNAGALTDDKAMEFGDSLKCLQIDVALISETWFVRDKRWVFPGYKMYNAKHPSGKARGGSSVVVRDNIKHSVIKIIESKAFQSAVIQIDTAIGSFNVASLYSPPRQVISPEIYLDLINNLGPKFLIGGDFNAKNVRWSSRLTNTKGENLEAAVNVLGGNFISPGKPTYFPPAASGHLPDCIDFFIYNNVPLENRTSCNTLNVKIDHAPVLLTVHSSPIFVNKPTSLVNVKTDWDKFRQLLTNKIHLNVRIDSIEKLELETEQLTNHIQIAAKSCTPVIKQKIRETYLPPDLVDLIRIKRKARNRMQVTRAEADKKEANRLTRIVKERLNKFRNEKFENFIKNLGAKQADDYSLWKATKYLKRQSLLSPPIRNGDSWASNSQEKADVIADHLEKTFQPNKCKSPEFQQILENSIKDINYLPDMQIENFSEQEISDEIKYKTKVKKAPGFDQISGIILKNLPSSAIRMLKKIFNAVITLRHIPSSWKKAEIIVLLKPGKPPADPGSYRPISLLPLIGKLFEKLFIKRLNKVVHDKSLLIDEQFGFRNKHGTLEQLHRVSATIEAALEEGCFCNAVFLDVQQAFDRVWHQKLIYKLSLMLPGNYVKILASYVSERYFRVRFEDSFSSFRSICAGVPQGSVLSPLLYSLFTTDIPRPRRGCKLGVFADDTVYLAVAPSYEQTVNLLQSSLVDMEEWTDSDRTALNAAKSENVVFTMRNYVTTPLVLNGMIIPHVKKAKYLGLTMDAQLRWKEHILKKKEQIEIKCRKMFWLFGRHSKLRRNNKILLYKSMVRPIWAYGSQIWACSAKTNVGKIEVVQNKLLRLIAGARWYERNRDIRAELGVESIEVYISNLYNNYEERLLHHPNTEAVKLLDWGEEVRRLKRRKPHELSTPSFLKI